MSGDAVLVLVIMLATVVLFVTEKFPLDMVAMLCLGALLGLGLVTPLEGLAGFSNSATVTVAAMFVLSAGLSHTGATDYVGRLMVRFGRNHFWALVTVMTAVTLMSAFVNNTAAVAVFIPLVGVLANRRRLSSSKLLIPLSYASQFGGVCTLIGTSTNLLVNSISEQAGYGAFSMFEFSRMGLILFFAGMLYFLVFGKWLLPDRDVEPLTTFHLDEYVTEMRIQSDSPLVGKTVIDSHLGDEHDVTVIRVLGSGDAGWAPLRQVLEPDNVLLVRGSFDELMLLRDTMGLELNADFEVRDEIFQEDDLRLVQVLIAPASELIGHTLKEVDFRNRYKALVLALLRRGESINDQLSSVRFGLGDEILLQAHEEDIRALRRSDDFIVLNEMPRRIGRRRAPLVLAVFAVVIWLAAFDVFPMLVAALLGCLALLLTRVLTMEEAYHAIDWQVIFVLAGILPLGTAMQTSGAAETIADWALGMVGDMGPVAVLAVLYLLTSVLTNMISNAAAAVLLAPIAISSAEALGVDPRSFLLVITFAASAGFSTPVGYQTNMMVYNAGGYRYTDFLRAGVPLSILFWVLSVIFIPQLWVL
ncbi:MAG: SLC13 family permease [Acidimicrobiia bacterium]|nr:SLC13 family permease [Acidimicrobiia bacterium]